MNEYQVRVLTGQPVVMELLQWYAEDAQAVREEVERAGYQVVSIRFVRQYTAKRAAL